MLFDDQYKTIAHTSEGLFKDKGSKFLAYAYPFTQESDLKGIISDLRTAHPKARHFCWAFRLTMDRSVFRLNDDGEPAGTAGRPILNTLLSTELTNILVVVVRYFGGTLLGVPGLIQAYKLATQDAIQNAELLLKTVNDVYEVNFEYLQMNDVMKVIKEEQLVINSQKFDSQCSIVLEIKKSILNQVMDKFFHLQGVKTLYINTI
jgi:uncharacterized YigZ family protein